ncbi:MAG: hypothetical protein IPP15_10160, partial [Saprospiraceae bacterium]|nr:hypothetical protein [Candidatus Opimibacter skivensis]
SAISLSIVAKPDLIVINPNAPSSANRGATITVSCTVKNSGNAYAVASMLKYYLSTNNSYSSNDIYMDSDPVSGLSQGSTSAESESFAIPYNLPTGTWYIILRADSDGQVDEANEANNVSYKQIQIN